MLFNSPFVLIVAAAFFILSNVYCIPLNYQSHALINDIDSSSINKSINADLDGHHLLADSPAPVNSSPPPTPPAKKKKEFAPWYFYVIVGFAAIFILAGAAGFLAMCLIKYEVCKKKKNGPTNKKDLPTDTTQAKDGGPQVSTDKVSNDKVDAEEGDPDMKVSNKRKESISKDAPRPSDSRNSAVLNSSYAARHRDPQETPGSFDGHLGLEPFYFCMKRHSLFNKKMAEIAEYHCRVNPERKIIDAEVSLLTNFVSDSITLINRFIVTGRQTLRKADAKFTKLGMLPLGTWGSKTDDVLRDVKTYEFVRFTAFGAMFGQFIRLEESYIQKYSLSLLLVIAFSPFIEEKTRRHALAVMRRKAPDVMQCTTQMDRKKYGYPGNALDAAVKKNPLCFSENSIQTKSSVTEVSQRKADPGENEKKTVTEETKEVPIQPQRRQTLQ